MNKRALLVVSGLAVVLALGALWLVRSRDAAPRSGSTDTLAAGGAGATPSPGARAAAGAPTAGSDKVMLAQAVTQGLLDFARKPWTKVPLRADGHSRAAGMMRAIAGSALDLERAKARRSTRFFRTAYTDDVTSDTPIHLADRWGADGRPTARQDAEAKALDEPMRVVYREGDDGTTFGLAKMKEQPPSSGPGLEAASATQQAESFLVENGLLAEAGSDRIEPHDVRERRVGTEAPNGGGDQDLLAQQDVLLRRTYDGKQVVNSHASVGVLPDSGEVVEIKVERWTPVDPAGTTTTKPPTASEQEAQRTATQLEEKLRRQIERDTGAELVSAYVEHIEEAWFQSDEGLIPVLVFMVRVAFTIAPNEPRNLIVAINPAGDDSLIWDQGRIVRETTAPSNPH